MLTTDYYQIDNLLWYSENIFTALVETNIDHVIFAKNDEFINNSYRYTSWSPLYYYANLYKPRYPGYDNFNAMFKEFLSLWNIFDYDLLRVEVLVLNYNAFSPKQRYNYQVKTPLGFTNMIAYGVRLIPKRTILESNIIVMNSNAFELFYCGEWKNNKYFGGY